MSNRSAAHGAAHQGRCGSYTAADFDGSCYTYDVHLRMFKDGSKICLPLEAPYYERNKHVDQNGRYDIGQVILGDAPRQTPTASEVAGQLGALLPCHKSRKQNESTVYFAHGTN